MNGIKMSDCRFYVNEDERTVVCVIPNTCNMVLNFVEDHFRWGDIDFWHSSKERMDRTMKMPNTFVGKAVCSPEDTWDEETGKLIAFSKAKDKCYRSFFKRATKFVQAIDRRLGDAMELFNKFGMKLDAKKTALESQIAERTGTKE